MIRIIPHKLKGEITVPPSKSMAHRAIICAALSEGMTQVHNVDFSVDVLATLNAVKELGAAVRVAGSSVSIGTVDFLAGSHRTLDCQESGSTLRFLLPLATLFSGTTRFIGSGNLGKRPLTPYRRYFQEQCLGFDQQGVGLDVRVSGSLSSGLYELEGNISSQFVSGLLLTLPLVSGDSIIRMTSPLQSRDYVDLTLSVLASFGIDISHENHQTYHIKGSQSYISTEYTVEADYSSAAFFMVANDLGGEIALHGLADKSLQADRRIIPILKQLNDCEAVSVIDGSMCPDIIPVVALSAALKPKTTRIVNIERLRIKESDRLSATVNELSRLGADITGFSDRMVIHGRPSLKGGTEVWSHRDHRIAMMLAVSATVCDRPIIIRDHRCVSKSYPRFFDDYQLCGGIFYECNMG